MARTKELKALDPEVINSEEYARKGKEYLMTNFFVIMVFELIAKPLAILFLGNPIVKSF